MTKQPILFTISLTEETYIALFNAAQKQSVHDLINNILEQYLKKEKEK